MTSTEVSIAVATALMIMAAVAWIDARCLADLRRSADWQLRYFDRRTWVMIILVSFPIGPALYLTCGKGPGRGW